MIPTKHVPRDPVLPQLATILNARQMAREFENGLQMSDRVRCPGEESRFRIEQCHVERIKYKPGRNCLVCYRLEVLDLYTGRRFDQHLTARIYEDGGSASRFARATRQTLVPSALGTSVIHIPLLNMVGWLFPNERKLDSLPALMDPESLRAAFLPPLIRARWGGSWNLESLDYSIVHYVPEHSCTLRVQMHLVRTDPAETKSWTVYGKAYYDDAGARSFHHMQQLWNSAERTRNAFDMPQPLHYDPTYRVLWQEGVSGRTLLDVCAETPGDSSVIKRAAAAIAGLHCAPAECSTRIETEDLVRLMRSRRGLLAEAHKSSGARLTAVTERLAFQASTLNTPSATVHGDLHPKNILITEEGRVFLIDLDNVSRGPALHDVGGWIAEQIYRAFLAGRDLPHVRPEIAAFIDGYRARVPWVVSAKELHWYTAAALLNERAFRCLTRMKLGRMEILDQLIELAEQMSLDYGILGVSS